MVEHWTAPDPHGPHPDCLLLLPTLDGHTGSGSVHFPGRRRQGSAHTGHVGSLCMYRKFRLSSTSAAGSVGTVNGWRRARSCPGAPGRAGGRPVARDRPGLRPADGARAAPVHDRPAPGRVRRPGRGASGRSSTTRPCWSTSAATPTPTSRPNGSATTSPLKSGKYDHELGSVERGAGRRCDWSGSGNPPLHRFRVGLEFAVSGHRDLNGMIAQHSALARRLAEQLGLSAAVQEAVGAAYEQWDGKGWPGQPQGRRHPHRLEAGPDRRVHRGRPPHRRSRRGRGPGREAGRVPVRPDLAATFCAQRRDHPGRARRRRDLGRGDRGRAVARSAAWPRPEFDAALLAIADFVDLKSPYTLGHARAVSELAAGGREPSSG